MIPWACRGIFLSISLRTGIYYSHLGFGLKWTEVDESGGVWQVPAPVVLKKLQFGSVSEFLDFSNMSIPVLSWFPYCPQKVTLVSLSQRLFQVGETSPPSPPAPETVPDGGNNTRAVSACSNSCTSGPGRQSKWIKFRNAI